jgi:hypothetical protein
VGTEGSVGVWAELQKTPLTPTTIVKLAANLLHNGIENVIFETLSRQ